MSGDPSGPRVLRPAVHFTARRNWLNDPNGLVFLDGEYHLFFQHNPDGADWGSMSWGHAVSADLATWTELPVALRHTGAEAVYSGSVVLDRDNTSGFGTPTGPALVAVHTILDEDTRRQSQTLAWSTDRGRTFTRYGHPVLDIGSEHFRDPKVFWHRDCERWTMVVARSREHRVALYASSDLRSWRHLSDFGKAGAVGGVWECPDLFRLDVENEPGSSAWVLLVSLYPGSPAGGSGTQYFVGAFDGTAFTATEHGWLDHGRDNYAGVTFNDAPDERRILIGWMSNWDYAASTPTRPWRGAMTVPRELRLRRVGDRLLLTQQPVLVPHRRTHHVERFEVADGTTTLPFAGTAYRVELGLRPMDATSCGLLVRVGPGQHTRIGYDAARGEVFRDRRRSGTTAFDARFGDVQSVALHRGASGPMADGELRLQVVVDTCSVEVFTADGTVCLTDLIFPEPNSTGIAVFAERGTALCTGVDLQALSPRGLWRNDG